MDNQRIFGKNVKKYRELHELSQEEFAHRLSINFSNISRIESGKQFVTADILDAISNILGVTASELFKADEEDLPKTPRSNTYIEKLVNYISALSEEDAQYIFESSKLYMKYKIRKKSSN